jgi:lysophospholipase L1-like esterase
MDNKTGLCRFYLTSLSGGKKMKATTRQRLKGTIFIAVVFMIAASMTPAFGAAIKVACIGDSITSGFGNGVTTPYPYALSLLLGSGYTVNNYGVISTTMLKRGDNPYWNTSQYTDSSNWLPDIVVIMLGTNDSKSYNWQYKSEFVANYEEMINHYKNLSSHPVVYVNTCATVYNGATGNYGITDPVVTGEVVPLVKQAANETGCPIIDINTATKGMPQNFPDYVHPNDAGYQVIANTVYKAITGATVTPTPVATATPTPVRTVTPTPNRTATPVRTATPRVTVTPVHTVTPNSTATPVRTTTPVVTPTPVPTTGSIKVQFYNQSTAATSNQIYLNIKLINPGSSAIGLSNVKIRYYYTVDGAKPQAFYCDYSPLGGGNVMGTFVTMATAKTGADTYVEVGFPSGAGSLAAGGNTTIQARVAKNDWTNYTQTNDYSFNSTGTSFADWTKVTGYVSGSLQWGMEP